MLLLKSLEKESEGHGLEVPCVYRFVAKQHLVKKLESLLQSPESCFYLVPFEQHSYMVRTDFYCIYYLWLCISE